MRWMDLESVIQSEVRQKEKNKYRILTHICGIQRNGTDEPICRAGVETSFFNTPCPLSPPSSASPVPAEAGTSSAEKSEELYVLALFPLLLQ